MGWPQVTMIVLLALQIIAAPLVHDKPATKNGVVLIISAGIEAFILYCGGFWK